MHDHALESLRYIRTTMERAGSFTAISGSGQMVVGATAMMAALVAARQTRPDRWLAVWLVEAALAAVIGAWSMSRKARSIGAPLGSGPSRRFAVGFLPPLFAGAALTPVLYAAAGTDRLPGMWLLLFGVAVVAGGAQSVRIVPLMGLAFMLLGAAALVSPPALGDLFMAAGFGGVLGGFGLIIARRCGG